MARPQPEQQAPPVQRLRVQYAKRGRARFTSHRDFARALERAIRRAGLPMAYSSGFSPHPRISYANASPTSAATEAEYLELGLSQEREPEQVAQALDQALPEGLDVVEVVVSQGGSLADLLTASAWQIDLTPAPDPVDGEVLERAVAALLAADSWQVQRMTKSGVRDFDVRAAIISLEAVPAAAADTPAGAGRLLTVIEHATPLVRPDDLLSALVQSEPELGSALPLLTRLAQGVPVAGQAPLLVDPFSAEPVRPW